MFWNKIQVMVWALLVAEMVRVWLWKCQCQNQGFGGIQAQMCVITCEQSPITAPVCHSFVCRLFICLCSDSGSRRSMPRSHTPCSRLSHAVIVMLKVIVFYFISFLLRFFCSLKFQVRAHTFQHTNCDNIVFSMNCGQQSVWRRLQRVKFALSCRSER